MTHTIQANGAQIPAIGLGTWQLGGRDCARLVEQAIGIGYRLIDTAQMYLNEAEVGQGVRASKRRDEVMVVTKVAPENMAPAALERSVKESLGQLRLDAIDLLLIHWPNKEVPLAESIGALCKMRRAGYARHIGVSNFTIALLAEAEKHATEPLVCNQIEVHPFIDAAKIVKATQDRDMAVMAYSPIAKGDSQGNETLRRIGKAHGKTAAQVSLRYLVQRSIVPIPRTSKIERLSENFAVFDFELTPHEMTEIAGLARPDGRLTDWRYSPEWDR